MTDTDEFVLILAPEAAACSQARREVGEFCRDRHLEHLEDSARLLISELVGNAIRETTTPVTVVGGSDGESLGVGVSGANAGRAELTPTLPDTAEERGRGLFVVDQLAQAWGYYPANGGTTVWFRLH